MNNLMMRVLLVAGILCALPVSAQVETRRTDELMQLSGLNRQLVQVREQMKAGAVDSRERTKAATGTAPLSDEDFGRILSAMDRAYAPATLQASMTREMVRLLPAADERAALTWLSSDLGRKFTAIEESSGELEAMRKGMREAPAHLATVPKERVELFQRLVDSVQAGEGLAHIVINTSVGVAVGIALANPNSLAPEAMAKAFREKLEPQRAQMVAFFGKQALEMYAYIYRGMSDAEVARYVAFAETPAGRKYHDATIKAMDFVFARASVEMGQQFQQLRTEPARRS